MYKLYDLVCNNCGCTTEEYVEFDAVNSKIVEEVLCEKCGSVMEPGLRDPKYAKHLSWGLWNPHNREG